MVLDCLHTKFFLDMAWYSFRRLGSPRKGNGGASRLLQTMANDLMTELKIRWWKSQDLYQSLVAGGDDRTKFKRDQHGDEPIGPSNIRMFGTPKRCCEDSFTVEAVAKL